MRLNFVHKRGFGLLRTLEIQLKNGYTRTPPPEYEFLKRYPPLSRDRGAVLREVKPEKIPYVKYYKAALEKNPALVGEHVYPAYWRQQPLALTLAKKQYEYVLQGLSEEKAYHKAVAFVDQQEGKSYDIMKELIEEIKKSTQARKSFVADPELIEIIQGWKKKLQKVPYSDLELHEQGDIDFIIQTKILKWKEVERERRMKDPVYFNQFIKLRNTIFPQIETNVNPDKLKEERMAHQKQQLVMNGLNPNLLCTKAPFFYEDYMIYFNKLKAQPLIAKWSTIERQGLSKWIYHVLSFRQMLENDHLDNFTMQRYLDCMRAQFFPMVQYTTRAKEFDLPTAEQFKSLLYNNDVGYKRVNGKLFVKRFYKLPALLFPVETVTTALIMDREGLGEMTREEMEKEVLKEVQTAGLDPSIVSVIVTRLTEYHTGPLSVINQDRFRGASDSSGDSAAGIDMTFLDELIRGDSHSNNNDDDDDDENDDDDDDDRLNGSSRKKKKNRKSSLDQEILDMISSVDSNADLTTTNVYDESAPDTEEEFVYREEDVDEEHDDEIEEEEEEEEEKKKLNPLSSTSTSTISPIPQSSSDINIKPPSIYKVFQKSNKDQMPEEEWNELVQNYVKIPVTALDRERDEFFKRMEYFDWQDAIDEPELYNFRRIRVENEIILKARLELIYEQKEAARRRVEWRKRKLWLGKDLPAPTLVLRHSD